MSISLTDSQEQFIQNKLESGKYRSAEEVLETAFQLLDEYESADTDWIEDVRVKVDAAIEASARTQSVDGETFISRILETF